MKEVMACDVSPVAMFSLEAQLPPKTKLHKIQKAALIALSGVAKVKTRGEILMPLAPTH